MKRVADDRREYRSAEPADDDGMQTKRLAEAWKVPFLRSVVRQQSLKERSTRACPATRVFVDNEHGQSGGRD